MVLQQIVGILFSKYLKVYPKRFCNSGILVTSIETLVWSAKATTGNSPKAMSSRGVVSGNKLLVFGGVLHGEAQDTLHCLDMSKFVVYGIRLYMHTLVLCSVCVCACVYVCVCAERQTGSIPSVRVRPSPQIQLPAVRLLVLLSSHIYHVNQNLA